MARVLFVTCRPIWPSCVHSNVQLLSFLHVFMLFFVSLIRWCRGSHINDSKAVTLRVKWRHCDNNVKVNSVVCPFFTNRGNFTRPKGAVGRVCIIYSGFHYSLFVLRIYYLTVNWQILGLRHFIVVHCQALSLYRFGSPNYLLIGLNVKLLHQSW